MEPPDMRLKELTKSGDLLQIDKKQPIRRYYRSGKEILSVANNYFDDEEYKLAYTLYYKYMILFLEKIIDHPEYKCVHKHEKEEVNKNIRVVMSRCEALKRQLAKDFEREYRETQERNKERRIKQEEQERQRQREEEERRKLEIQRYCLEKEETASRQRDLEISLYHKLQIQEEQHDHQHQVPKSTTVTPPAIPDRSTKPSTISKTTKSGLKPLIVPSTLMDLFLSLASSNTENSVETCGILAGNMSKQQFRISHLILPKQTGTSDSCTMLNEEDIFDYQDKHKLITLGWIHTHPSQTAFLSSVDLHNHMSYQLMIPEALAIVCSPKYDETGFFNLTPYGLDFIAKCRDAGFHPHPSEPPLFEEGSHVILDNDSSVVVADLR